MSALGQQLFGEVTPKFFGLLAGPNAGLYLDAIDALEKAMAQQGDTMERAEAMALLDELLLNRQILDEDADPETTAETPAGRILSRLIRAGWLEEEARADYRKILTFEPSATLLLEALRSIVSRSVAAFTGKLRLACDQLANLQDMHTRSQLTWGELRECLFEIRAGLRELRSVRKQVERYGRRQLTTTTIAGALELVYGEFSPLITQQCYRELIHARLPDRLREARLGLDDLERDDFTIQQLATEILRLEPGTVSPRSEILHTIEAINQALGDVEPTAEKVDAGTAEFARRSRARIRYIQDVGSSRRQQIKRIFDHVREHLSGIRLADLDGELELPRLRLVDDGLIGSASLAKPRHHSEAANRTPVVAALTDADKERSLLEMEKNLRNALRLDRANKYVDRLDLPSGARIASKDLELHTEDDLLDMLSCLVYTQAAGARFRLEIERSKNPEAPVLSDTKAGFQIERFELEKK